MSQAHLVHPAIYLVHPAKMSCVDLSVCIKINKYSRKKQMSNSRSIVTIGLSVQALPLMKTGYVMLFKPKRL